MYKVKFSINGLVKEMTISANDSTAVTNIITNMYSESNVQIIDVRRV